MSADSNEASVQSDCSSGRLVAALNLLQRIRDWDHLSAAEDGRYWIGEIDLVLNKHLGSSEGSSGPCSTPCHRCIDDFDIRFEQMSMFKLSMVRMILCEHCGNKRCPHATDHRLECTGSNEPGQDGSIYR